MTNENKPTSFINSLNALANEVFPDDNLLTYVTPIKFDFTGAFQVVSFADSQTAFLLDQPKAATYRNNSAYFANTQQPMVIARQQLSYSMVDNLITDKTKFTLTMGHIFQELINELVKVRPDVANPLDKPKVCFKTPWDGAMFFEIQERAGVEFRVYVQGKEATDGNT